MQATGSEPSATAHGADADTADGIGDRQRSPTWTQQMRLSQRSRAPRLTGRSHRAQTTLDFAVGMSLFLLSLTFIMMFVPGMLGPFTDGTQDDIPAADRAADDLATRLLGSADDPYVLDPDCTREFFTSGAPADCSFDGSSLQERLGVLEWRHVNVTISGNVSGPDGADVLCWEDSAGTYVERDAAACGGSADAVLSRGSDPTVSGGKTISARRVASLEGTDVTIEVVMW